MGNLSVRLPGKRRKRGRDAETEPAICFLFYLFELEFFAHRNLIRPPKKLQRIGEAVNSNFLKALGAEFLGTMMFMFILVSQIVFSCYIGEGAEGNKLGASTCLLNPVRVLPIAATAGLTMFVLIYATASFSGGE